MSRPKKQTQTIKAQKGIAQYKTKKREAKIMVGEMRTAARTDANHLAIMIALRQIPGVSVFDISRLGHGTPDLLIGFRAKNLLLEVKNGKNPPSQRRLTSDQMKWHQNWTGQVYTVTSINEAVDCVLNG